MVSGKKRRTAFHTARSVAHGATRHALRIPRRRTVLPGAKFILALYDATRHHMAPRGTTRRHTAPHGAARRHTAQHGST
eukprot:gene10183-biopygen409